MISGSSNNVKWVKEQDIKTDLVLKKGKIGMILCNTFSINKKTREKKIDIEINFWQQQEILMLN